MTSDLKRLRFAQNSYIDVERCGGNIVGGTAPEWVNGAHIMWRSVAVGEPVEIHVWAKDRADTGYVVRTRPLESMGVLEPMAYAVSDQRINPDDYPPEYRGMIKLALERDK